MFLKDMAIIFPENPPATSHQPPAAAGPSAGPRGWSTSRRLTNSGTGLWQFMVFGFDSYSIVGSVLFETREASHETNTFPEFEA